MLKACTSRVNGQINRIRNARKACAWKENGEFTISSMFGWKVKMLRNQGLTPCR